jgi:hypothetical protein
MFEKKIADDITVSNPLAKLAPIKIERFGFKLP